MRDKPVNEQQHSSISVTDRNSYRTGRPNDGSRIIGVCWNCGTKGHPAVKCQRPQIGNGLTFKPPRSTDESSANPVITVSTATVSTPARQPAFNMPASTAQLSRPPGHVDVMSYGGGLKCYMLIHVAGKNDPRTRRHGLFHDMHVFTIGTTQRED
jgi:hypothetical protein